MAVQGKNTSPTSHLVKMLVKDRREFLAILIYSFLNSLLLLAVPLAAQGLVNVVVAGLYLQPLIVLSGALFLGLLFAGILAVMRFYLVEVMRERVFARVALRVADRLPQVCHRALAESNGPELMNRFFDVINVQKSWFKLAYDGPGAVLEILVGLSLLALYGMELLSLGVGLLSLGAFLILLAGYRGLTSSLGESTQKYRVAEWLEEMVRCHQTMKLNCRPRFWAEETDRRVVAFLSQRRRHFGVLLRQHLVYYSMAALGASGMLGLGGYLVVQGQLSLGQLVAAELVVWSILKATEKLVRSIEAFFDLLTGLHKVSVITSMPLEEVGAIALPLRAEAAAVSLEEVHFSYASGEAPVVNGLNLEVKPGEMVSLLGDAHSGKSTLIRILAGFLRPQKGYVEIDDLDLRELSPETLAKNVAIISTEGEVFAGTLVENIRAGRHCDLKRARDLLGDCGGKSILQRLPEGANSQVASGATTLSGSEKESLLLTRALLGGPRLVLIDEAFANMSESQRRDSLATLLSGPYRPTVISTVALPELVAASDRICWLEGGRLVETVSPKDLATGEQSRFASVFPTLAHSAGHLASQETFQ